MEEDEDTQVVDVDGAVSSLQSTFEGGATITLDERDIARAKEVSAFCMSIALRVKDCVAGRRKSSKRVQVNLLK